MTWVRDQGYRQLPNNGSMRHVGFDTVATGPDGAAIDERLVWVTQSGRTLFEERRRLGVWVRPRGRGPGCSASPPGSSTSQAFT